jgi:hypothetical protein
MAPTKKVKKVKAYVKLNLPAGKATPAPPVGPALGQHGVPLMDFCKEFNARTAQMGDAIIPVVLTVFEDRSFDFITKTPLTSYLIKKSLKADKKQLCITIYKEIYEMSDDDIKLLESNIEFLFNNKKFKKVSYYKLFMTGLSEWIKRKIL